MYKIYNEGERNYIFQYDNINTNPLTLKPKDFIITTFKQTIEIAKNYHSELLVTKVDKKLELKWL